MKKNSFLSKIIVLLNFSLICILVLPQTVYAVPPPDFLFNVGTQVVQVFSIAVIFLSAIFSVSYKYIKTKLELMKSRKVLFISLSLLVIVGISIGTSYLYGNYKQDAEYGKWLAESKYYNELPEEQQEYITQKRILRNIDIPTPEKGEETEIDKLKIGDAPRILRLTTGKNLEFISNIENIANDPGIEFIEKYYQSIAEKKFQAAYEMSKKSVSLDVFASWYVDTTKVTIDKLVRIDDESSSLDLTLYEGDKYTRYAVIMALKMENGKPASVLSSDVRVLSEGTLKEKGDEIIAEKGDEKGDKVSFYSTNEINALSISNSAFSKKTKSQDADYIILDAREDLEYNNGYFPGSTHIRFADLQAGKWIELPEDKFVYVLCWSGIRGKEVAEFLRTKNIVASYLENGANGWVEWGGKWTGGIKFSEKYVEEKYKKIFSTSEVKTKVSNGVLLVDTREPWKFEGWHIPGSVNIPIMYTPTNDLEKAFAQVPAGSTVITVCDNYVNCFDAKITAVELEERGNAFIGRYNKPWEYEE